MVHTRSPGHFFYGFNFSETQQQPHHANLRFFGKVISPSDLLILGGPAGGSAPGKVLRPLKGIPHDSWSLSSSKSNTAAGEIQIKRACQNSWQLGPKNEDFSKSVNSIDRGAIFPTRSRHDLSRNAVVVSVYALYKNLY